MKVKIGNYKSFYGPYQIADWFKKVGLSEDKCDKIGDWICKTPIGTLCEWLEKHRHRKIKIKLDPWDIWSMDHTLALIALPMLKQLKSTKHGAPTVDESDVPFYLTSVTAIKPPDPLDGLDENFFLRWDYVMDEMIWTFEQLAADDNEAQFYIPNTGPTPIFDKDAFEAHNKRITNGLRLFGKYYRSLWD